MKTFTFPSPQLPVLFPSPSHQAERRVPSRCAADGVLAAGVVVTALASENDGESLQTEFPLETEKTFHPLSFSLCFPFASATFLFFRARISLYRFSALLFLKTSVIFLKLLFGLFFVFVILNFQRKRER
jgi:hypothetical protein